MPTIFDTYLDGRLEKIILRLEICRIANHRKESICDFFVEYLERNELTEDNYKKIIMGCAIRKLIWYITNNEYSKRSLSQLLNMRLSIELKLQILTSSVLAYETKHLTTFDVDFKRTLTDLVNQYAKNSAMTTRYERSVGLNSLLLLYFSLEYEKVEETLCTITSTWFTTLFSRRVKMIEEHRNKLKGELT